MFRVYKQRHKSWGELYVQSVVLVGFIRSVLIKGIQQHVVITVNYCKCILLYSPLNSYLYVHWILDFK